jgi:hypothetical protein
VSRFQQKSEQRKQQTALMQGCFAQFLLYTNSIWQEYYLIFPLIQQADINKEEYNHYINEISLIKLKRYDAYVKVVALSIVFRRGKKSHQSKVEEALRDYAIYVNRVSEAIDTWLRNLYCAPAKCLSTTYAPIKVDFNPYDSLPDTFTSHGRIDP